MSIKEGLDSVGIDDWLDKNDVTENDKNGATAVEQPVNVSDGEAVVKKKPDDEKRRRNLTEKGREYQQKLLFDKRKKIHSRMMRQSQLIDSLMCSPISLVTVKEETQQFDDQFKMFMEVNKQYVDLLSDQMKEEEDTWFQEIDEFVFTQKHKIHNWIKGVEERSSRRSIMSKSSKTSTVSDKTKSSRNSSKKSSLKEQALQEKLKMAELLAEASFIEEKHAAMLEAEKLKKHEELAKVKARSKILDEMQKDEYPAETRVYFERKDAGVQR